MRYLTSFSDSVHFETHIQVRSRVCVRARTKSPIPLTYVKAIVYSTDMNCSIREECESPTAFPSAGRSCTYTTDLSSNSEVGARFHLTCSQSAKKVENSLLAPPALLNGRPDGCLGDSAEITETLAENIGGSLRCISFLTGVHVLTNSKSKVLPCIVWHT